jgi:hypothetical protein
VERIVVGALHSKVAADVAVSVLGRHGVRIADCRDLFCSVEFDGACALLFELGHPAYDEFYTRLSVLGTSIPLIIVLPAGPVSASQLLSIARLGPFSLAYDHRELPAVLRRTMTRRVASSDAQVVGQALDRHLASSSAALSLGLYVAGTRNVNVAQASARVGFRGALRNRLRVLGLARASTILGWASAMGIIWRMEQDDCSLTDAARAAGFDTTRQWSDRVLYHTGRTPTALRDQYGFRALVEEFTQIVSMRIFSAA